MIEPLRREDLRPQTPDEVCRPGLSALWEKEMLPCSNS